MRKTDNFEKRILIVEDEGLIATDIQARLGRLGYPRPMVARSGVEAIECARSTPFDLVLMDIRLAGDMDGIATASALKSESEAAVVYMTAHSDDETIKRAKVTEPLGYILKPVSDGDLRSVVEISLYRHEMERRVRTSEAWLSATLRSVGEGIIATNAQCEVVFLNPLAERMTGWSKADAHGQPLMQILGLHDEGRENQAGNPILTLDEGESRSYDLVSKAGDRALIEIECFENRSGDEVLGSIAVMRDIRRRRETEARILQTQRMEALANLAGGLAHDFNNQLMLILGHSDELSEKLTGDYREQAREIRQACCAAAELTAQLATLSRKDAARLEVVNMNEVLLEAVPLIERSLPKNQNLTVALGDTAGLVRADRGQMRQVLLNLALSARDSMPAGGEIHFETSIWEIDSHSPAAHQYRPRIYQRILMTDTGEGIEKRALPRIFEPQFTTESGFTESLNLSIVHSLVTRCGGYISASSEPGQGRSMEILLPCVGTFLGNRETSAPTVLLVEDEDTVRRLMQRSLEREGYQLLAARSGEEASAIAEAYADPIHVLITDMTMPGMNGPELAERLRTFRMGMKVLLLSGYGHDRADLERSGDVGGNILPKPFRGEELLRRVDMLLAQQTAART